MDMFFLFMGAVGWFMAAKFAWSSDTWRNKYFALKTLVEQEENRRA